MNSAIDITNSSFNTIVETVYNLPLEERLELKSLLENNIADSRRSDIASNYKKAQTAQKNDRLTFSSSITDLKKML